VVVHIIRDYGYAFLGKESRLLAKVMNIMTPDLAEKINAKLDSYRTLLEKIEAALNEEMCVYHEKRRIYYLQFLRQEQCVLTFAASELKELLHVSSGDVS
jgi:hypothetical protein